jgi:peptidoglycan/xylan/chitin deacetylase (PgdA/CDA1 family)
MLLYIYRRYVFTSAVLLTYFLYAMLLTGRGMTQPHFVIDETASNVKQASGLSLRKVSDFLAGRKYVVLTFDDGPYGYGVDEQIMATLKKHHARAMFFLVCSHINDADRHVLGELEGAGHLIGNHSYDHLKLDTLTSKSELEHQIDGCSQRLAQLTGRRPSYFRPPFGATSPLIAHVAQAAGMKQMLWNANSQDSWMTQPEQILHWSLEQTEDQSVLLMHEKPATAAVLDDLLTQLEQRGFQFVLPDQLSDNTAIN